MIGGEGQMAENFSDVAVFCANCGRQMEPGDTFCRDCGSKQTQEVNIEPINVDKKMRLRAAELLPDIERPDVYVPLMSDGMPARGGADPLNRDSDYRQPVFCPKIEDVSIKHEKPVEIQSTEIDIFNFRFSYLVPSSDEEKQKWYPNGEYCFHLIRTSKGARCRIEIHRYNDNREETFDADAFALTRLDTLLKERDVAQLDGYSVHSLGTMNSMDLLVLYVGGERIAATGLPPINNKYYHAEWFMDFFRNLSGAFGKNIFSDSFKERELEERRAARGNGSAANSDGGVAPDAWQCECGQLNQGPFCCNCGKVKP